jgi:hypothetical protein
MIFGHTANIVNEETNPLLSESVVVFPAYAPPIGDFES